MGTLAGAARRGVKAWGVPPCPYHHGNECADVALLHDDVPQRLQGQPLRRTLPAWSRSCEPPPPPEPLCRQGGSRARLREGGGVGARLTRRRRIPHDVHGAVLRAAARLPGAGGQHGLGRGGQRGLSAQRHPQSAHAGLPLSPGTPGRCPHRLPSPTLVSSATPSGSLGQLSSSTSSLTGGCAGAAALCEGKEPESASRSRTVPRPPKYPPETPCPEQQGAYGHAQPLTLASSLRSFTSVATV